LLNKLASREYPKKNNGMLTVNNAGANQCLFRKINLRSGQCDSIQLDVGYFAHLDVFAVVEPSSRQMHKILRQAERDLTP